MTVALRDVRICWIAETEHEMSVGRMNRLI